MMIDDVTLKFKLKQKVDLYNADQKSLHVSNYLFRILLVMILLVFVLLIVFLFVVPILTPLFLKKGIYSDVLSLSCSGCMISMFFVGSVVYFVQSRLPKKLFKKPDVTGSQNAEPSLESLLADNSDLDLPKQTREKKHFLSRHLKLFSLVKELFSFMFSILFSPIAKPDYLYFDKTRADFTVSLVNSLIDTRNHVLNLSEIKNNYLDYSNTWLANTLKVLLKVKVINICDLETGERVILLNLDFYNPDLITDNHS